MKVSSTNILQKMKLFLELSEEAIY
jgi:hypothetical protein